MNYYLDAFRNYFNFSGRATRTEYWMFVLFNVIVSFVLGFVTGLLLGDSGSFIVSLYSLAVFFPALACGVRRLHDSGKSGLWYLLCLTVVGSIVVLIFLCLPSQEGSNKWG